MTIKHMVGQVLRSLFPDTMERLWVKNLNRKLMQELKAYKDLNESEIEAFVRKQYQKKTGHELNLENPQRFTEKIQWRKFFDRDPVYAQLSDKYRVRQWVAEKIGQEYLIPLLGVWERFEDIDFAELPNQFVLKTNNACETNTIVTDKAEMNRKLMTESYHFWMQRSFGFQSMELHYNAIKPLIIAEKYMEPEEGKSDLTDYKFFCFSGKPMYCQIISNRNSHKTIDFYDMNWQWQKYRAQSFGNQVGGVKRPHHLEQMKELSQKLSDGFAFVRVDFYEIHDKVYFGEMTFTPAGGYNRFTPDDWDFKLGALWDITVPQIDREKVAL